jgi:hypothetical protein
MRATRRADVTRQLSRGDLVTPETASHRAGLKTRRAEATVDADVHPTSTALEAGRSQLRRGRADLDLAAIERLRRPS